MGSARFQDSGGSRVWRFMCAGAGRPNWRTCARTDKRRPRRRLHGPEEIQSALVRDYRL